MALKTLYLDTSSINSGMLLGENGTLYGTDQKGKGNIFSVSTDGISLSILHTFNGTDGQSPNGYLILHNNILYGTTYSGGSINGGGYYFFI